MRLTTEQPRIRYKQPHRCLPSSPHAGGIVPCLVIEYERSKALAPAGRTSRTWTHTYFLNRHDDDSERTDQITGRRTRPAPSSPDKRTLGSWIVRGASGLLLNSQPSYHRPSHGLIPPGEPCLDPQASPPRLIALIEATRMRRSYDFQNRSTGPVPRNPCSRPHPHA